MKQLNSNKTTAKQDRNRTMQENWEVMKPFVHFSIKAMALIGGVLIGIIKLLPSLLEHKEQPTKKNNKVIKI